MPVDPAEPTPTPARSREPEAGAGADRLGEAGRWLGELVRLPWAAVGAYVPGLGGLRARTREQLVLAVHERDGHRSTAWIHGTWLDFLGDRDPDEALGPLFAYARSCAEHGRPLDATTLEAVYPAALVRSVRATVARARLEDLGAGALDDCAGRLRLRRPSSLGRWLSDTAVLVGTAPLVAPVAIAAGAMWVADRLAPGLPPVVVADDDGSNLVVDLVATAVPTYLGGTLVRTGLVRAPFHVSIAFRMEGKAATLTIGRGQLLVRGGVQPDALVVVDGGLDAVLPVVAGSLAGQLTAVGPVS